MQAIKANAARVRWMIRGDAYGVSRISVESCQYRALSSREIVLALKQRQTIGTIIELNDVILGYLIMDMTTSDYFELVSFAVDALQRGEGYGTLLIAHAEKVARNLGFVKISGTVPERSLESQLFLAANGFKCLCLLRGFFGVDDGYFFEKVIA